MGLALLREARPERAKRAVARYAIAESEYLMMVREMIVNVLKLVIGKMKA
jgi:hypothetical protein